MNYVAIAVIIVLRIILHGGKNAYSTRHYFIFVAGVRRIA